MSTRHITHLDSARSRALEVMALKATLPQESVETFVTFLVDDAPNVPRKIKGLVIREEAKVGIPEKNWVAMPELDMYCENEGGVRRFRSEQQIQVGLWGRTNAFVVYGCKNCQKQVKTIALLIERKKDTSDIEVMKFGEFPPFGAPVSPRLRELLGDHEDLFKKGWNAERQGLGIGAAAYYRRIVEMKWRDLVEELRKAAVALGSPSGTVDLFDQALKQTQFSAAVTSLKDGLPPKLFILDGVNPLTLLHGSLSQDLHSMSDEDCLATAAATRRVLEALIENVAQAQSHHDELKAAVSQLRRENPTE